MIRNTFFKLMLSFALVIGLGLTLQSCSEGLFSGKSNQKFRGADNGDGDGSGTNNPNSGDGVNDPNGGDDGTTSDSDKIDVDTGEDSTDPVRITVGEYIESFDPITITGLRMEDGGTHRGATMTLAISKINDKTLSAASRNKTKISVAFPDEGKSVQVGRLCPNDNKGKVTYEMQIQFKSLLVNVGNKGNVLGYRPGTKNSNQTLIEVGYEDHGGKTFHEIDGVIARFECPQAKSIQIKDLCYDAVLDDDFKRCSWYAWRSSQPCYKNWGKTVYAPQCK